MLNDNLPEGSAYDSRAPWMKESLPPEPETCRDCGNEAKWFRELGKRNASIEANGCCSYCNYLTAVYAAEEAHA